MKLKKRKRYINFAAEGAPIGPPMWKQHLSKIVYFAFLGALGLWVGSLLFTRGLFVQGEGFLLLSASRVVAENGLTIDTLFHSCGDSVSAGEPLCTGWMDREENGGGVSSVPSQRLARANRDLELRRVDLRYSKKELAGQEEELKKLQEMHSLEMVMADKVKKQQKAVNKTRQRIKELGDQIAVLSFYRKRLGRQVTLGVATQAQVTDDYDTLFVPMSGLLSFQVSARKRYLPKGEVLACVLPPDSPKRIEGFFGQRHASFLAAGTKVSCRFRSGQRSSGIISSVSMTTEPLPEEFQKKGEPTERAIRATIVPLDDKASEWPELDHEIVKMKIRRF